MEPKPGYDNKIQKLLQRGVNILNPSTVHIGEEVLSEQISSEGVIIYPGCRIFGEKTVISAGCRIGYEAPATIENCRLGKSVELKGGFFSNSVFLDKAHMGMAAHVREGCILEEEANGAHCVGLKQTILFPFVTLGSLINFCDCFMAGGTSRQNHSEVGSSYIHFNFTPDADKTTPSLLGDVPRGVMLNQPPIFLGGQGGIVGPVRLGFGNVVAAGSILRKDYLDDNRLIFASSPAAAVGPFVPALYPQIGRILKNNILYLANLEALAQWYMMIRKPFFAKQEFGMLIYQGAMEQLALAGKERLKRLHAMAKKAASPKKSQQQSEKDALGQGFYEHMKSIEAAFNGDIISDETASRRDEFLIAFDKVAGDSTKYIETVQSLPAPVSSMGVRWLNGVVDDFCKRIAALHPALELFKNI